MRQAEMVDPQPTVIHCNINIVHHQLRDLLQPAGEKGKVLFVNGLKIDCADFTTKKVPTTFSTLDFSAVCLTTGSGLVAAGGQQSELDIRPLLPFPSTSNEGTNGESSSSAANDSTESLQPSGSTFHPRQIPRWHLRTPTGGSINNSICIQPDASRKGSHSSAYPGVAIMRGTAAISEDKDILCRHREKRRKEINELMEDEAETQSAWRRDDPSGRMMVGGADRSSGESSQDRLDAIIERNKIGLLASEQEVKRRGEQKAKAQQGEIFAEGLMRVSPFTQPLGTVGSVRVLVSNNDQSVKEFRLRPPTRWRPSSATNSGGVERIESGLPGLSRLQTVEFPTCINHSSFSPDGRHLISVGDTPEVFLYSVDPVSGDLAQIATYNASSDASFCTSWSPNGLQFAVASQDGLVSVWDVRSSAKIATLQTSQMSDVRGSGAARVVKWSPRGDLLAFSEHKNYIHIVETSTFTSSQRIKVPSGAAGQTRNAACNTDAGAREASATGADEVDVDDMLHSSTDTSTSASQGLLEATALNRFSTGVRNGSNSRPPWHGERRMRDFLSSGDLISGGSNIMRSPLDRALLGEWSSSRLARSRGAADDVEVYIDDRNPGARSAITNDTSTSMLARTVDNIMATFETESGLRNSAAGFWTSGGMPRRSHRSDDAIDISGLTWDPDGDYLYVSTEDLIAQYSVLDLRRSFGKAVMR